MRRRLRLPEEQTVVHVRNRVRHFELMGQTLGGIFVFLLRQASQTPIERARSVGVCAIRILHQWRITAVTKAICEERVERQCPRGLLRFEIRSAAGPSTRMRGSARRLPITPCSRSGL